MGLDTPCPFACLNMDRDNLYASRPGHRASATIGAGQKAALAEAYVAIISMLPTSLGKEFMGIGGYSLMSLGSNRKTEHIDFAVSANGLNAFEQAAKNDPRLHEGSIDE